MSGAISKTEQKDQKKSTEEAPLMETLSKVLNISLPAIVSMISAFSIQVANTVFAGHLGDPAIMAGVGMATMYVNIFCNSLMIGLNSTLNTLLSQAVGFDDFHLCGVYLNRSRIVLTLMYVPLAILLLQTRTIFDALGFD
jgi:MATE family multidrug resistance protein